MAAKNCVRQPEGSSVTATATDEAAILTSCTLALKPTLLEVLALAQVPVLAQAVV